MAYRVLTHCPASTIFAGWRQSNGPTAALAQHNSVADRLEFWQGWTTTLGFAQQLLRNLGQLVRIDPSLGMAEFISNSAISLPIRASAVLAAAPNSGPGRPKMADFTLKSAILRQVDRGGLVA